jgi:DNA polymerase V
MSFTIIGPLPAQGVQLPFYSRRVAAGFPSPAADHLEKHISLDELFNNRASHLYLLKIEGESMIGAGIHSGDLVIVDRSREAQHGDIVIAALNIEPVRKRLNKTRNEIMLTSETKVTRRAISLKETSWASGALFAIACATMPTHEPIFSLID